MINAARKSFSFLTFGEKTKYVICVLIRCLTAFLDLLGILAIGYVAASISLFIATRNNSNQYISVGDFSIPAATQSTLLITAIGVVGVFVAKALISVIMTNYLTQLIAQVEARATEKITKVSLSGGLDFFRYRTNEEIVYSIQVGASSAFSGLLNSYATIFSELALFTVMVITFALMDIYATIGILIFLAGSAALIQVFVGKKIVQASEVFGKSEIEANGILADTFTAFREISTFGRAEHFVKRVYEARLRASKSHGRQIFLSGMPRYVIETTLIIGVFSFVGVQTLFGDLANVAGTIGVFLTGGLRIMAALVPWQIAIVNAKENTPRAKLAHDLLCSTTFALDSGESPNTSNDESTAYSITFDNVSYSYGDGSGYALREISFVLEPGHQMAVIGKSGAGKSTLADLVLGLASPQKGYIQVDGQPVSQALKAKGSRLGYLPQKPGIIAGSLRDNILFGEPPEAFRVADFKLAIEMSGLGDVIEKLSSGIDTDLGSKRDGLSGGQLQRLGLARALYAKPKLLVTDEATSGLDVETEQLIVKSLNSLKGQTTVVVIAHRLETILSADKVLVLDKGSLVDFGNFSDVSHRHPWIKDPASLN